MRIFAFIALLLSGVASQVIAQTAPPVVASPTPSKPSTQLSKIDLSKVVSREDREVAYKKLLEGQRNIWRMRYQRTQAGRMMFAEQARAALLAALDTDPKLSEGYVALIEMWLMIAPTDIDEAAALSSMAVRINKDSVGGHKFYARVLTRQSGFRTSKANTAVAVKAIEEWKEVVRLDPRSSEAWAMLSELYDGLAKSAESIDSLKKWVASTSSVDTIWYRQIIGGQPEDLLPENAAPRLSSALIAAGRPEEAIGVLTQILSDDPDNTEVFSLISRAVESADTKIAPKLVESVRQIVLANPGNVTLLISFAGLVSKVGNTDEAVAMLTAAFDKLKQSDLPAAANIQLSIGDLYLARDRSADAVTAYERAFTVRGLDKTTALDPDEREFATAVFEKLITVYKRANKMEEAKAVIARAKKLLGDESVFDRMLISLYRDMGMRTDALAALGPLRIQEPDDVSLLRLEATLLVQTGQIDRGIGLIRKRIDSGKAQSSATPRLDDDFSNLIFIAQLYDEAGKGIEAAAASDEALAAAGASEDRRQIARLMKASALQMAGKYAEAEGILQAIIKASPRNPIALNNLGYFLLLRDERLPEAYELIRQAVDIDPTNPSYLDSLGWAHFKLGRLDEAIKSLEEAARLDDTSATIQEHLGDAYVKKGIADRARSAWQRAATLSPAGADLARVKEKLANMK